jgi:hypothetical protein
MTLGSVAPTKRTVIGIAIGIVLLVAVTLIVVLVAGDDDSSQPTPLQQVLREIRDDGTWSKETALRAFSAVFGPLPGVEVPEGPEAEVEFGTIAIRMLSLYIDEITPEQRVAVLAAAGPLADFVTGSAGGPGAASSGPGLPEPVVQSMGLPADAGVLAADAEDYETEIAGIITSIESRVGRSLGLEVEVVVSPDPVGILHATALPLADDGENINGCRVTVLPNAQSLSGVNLTAVLAHETWHCFEYSRLGTLSRRKSSPPWIMEGQAMWVGEAAVGGTQGLEPTDRHWKEYLIDPGPGVGLFARSYDAIGFYSHLQDQGIDAWTVLDPILDQTSNLAAFQAAVGGKSLDVVTTWAPSWYRDGDPTSTFALINAPGIPGPTVRPAPVTFTISNGTFQQVTALKPLSAEIADVAIASEILTIDVTGQAMVGDMMFGDEITFVASARTFCMVENCACPDGAPGPTEHLGDELRVAVTGDALSGSDALLRGWSIDDWCQEKPAPPGSGGGPRTPCQAGCGSSNGDPHLTTIDGRSYDFQAAGEFVLLRSAALEVQARQEPYQGSSSVTINTAVAVAADGGRAAVYAAPEGLRLLVDGTETPLTEAAGTGGLEITPVPEGVQIAAPDGTIVWALGLGEWGINILVSPSPDLLGEGTGLLSATGEGQLPALPDGTEVDIEADYRNALYLDLADAWAVTAEGTLFDYEDGSGPANYRDPSIPEPGAPIDFFELPEVLQTLGREACIGIADEALLIQCAFDVAVTDDPGFVAGYESTDQFIVTSIEDELGSLEGGALSPLFEEVAVVAGSALDDSGTLFLSVRFDDQHRELAAIDPVTQTVVARVETDQDGQIAVAAGSVWMSTTTESGCAVNRFDRELGLEATIEIDCVLGFMAPQLVFAGDSIWVYEDEPALTRIDPIGNSFAESVSLPFPNGFLRSTGETIFYTDIEEGVHRLLPGSGAFEDLGAGHILIHPGGDGFWEQDDGAVTFYQGPGTAPATMATDGVLVGATNEAALVERSLQTGTELWAYPADGGGPISLASAPLIGSGSEERALDYFDNSPPISSPSLVVKVWVEYATSGDEETALFVQAIPVRQ